VGFDAFFKSGAGNHRAYPYQVRSAEHAWPETLVVPTGFGKTAAVLAAWLWKIGRGDAETPRRLVYCLPMRTLVEQTESAAKRWIDTARSVLGLEVNLDVLMGGRSEGRRGLPKWMLYPERPAILIGTQDILISAALMRGYQVLARRVRLGLIEARSSDTDAGLMATGIRGRRATRVFSVRRMGKSMGNTAHL
jgi:CRISPR-associated endonuclease/helicase Cas3